MMDLTPVWVNNDTFFSMLKSGWVVDGRGGGLILGRSHAQGGILVIESYNLEQFVIRHEFEGGEYLVNRDSSDAAIARLEEINCFVDIHPELSALPITRKTRVINTHAEPRDKLIWIDRKGQFIVRHEATAKFFSEIEDLNEKENDTLECDFDLELKHPGSIAADFSEAPSLDEINENPQNNP